LTGRTASLRRETRNNVMRVHAQVIRQSKDTICPPIPFNTSGLLARVDPIGGSLAMGFEPMQELVALGREPSQKDPVATRCRTISEGGASKVNSLNLLVQEPFLTDKHRLVTNNHAVRCRSADARVAATVRTERIAANRARLRVRKSESLPPPTSSSHLSSPDAPVLWLPHGTMEPWQSRDTIQDPPRGILDPRATMDPFGTIDSRCNIDTRGTIDPFGTMDSRCKIDARGTMDPRGTTDPCSTMGSAGGSMDPWEPLVKVTGQNDDDAAPSRLISSSPCQHRVRCRRCRGEPLKEAAIAAAATVSGGPTTGKVMKSVQTQTAIRQGQQ
jgi:hypothetical protein